MDDLRTKMMGGREADEGVMKTMIIFSLLMCFFPVFLYFFSKIIFFEAFIGMSSQDSYFYSAFVAIAAVHVILGLFVYKAFTSETSSSVKKD